MAIANSLSADIIVLTGDYVTNSTRTTLPHARMNCPHYVHIMASMPFSETTKRGLAQTSSLNNSHTQGLSCCETRVSA